MNKRESKLFNACLSAYFNLYQNNNIATPADTSARHQDKGCSSLPRKEGAL